MHTKQVFLILDLGHSFCTATLRNYVRTWKTGACSIRKATSKR